MYSEGTGEHTQKDAAFDRIKVWEEGRTGEEMGSNNRILLRGSMRRGRHQKMMSECVVRSKATLTHLQDPS